jgi:hypothetical protein
MWFLLVAIVACACLLLYAIGRSTTIDPRVREVLLFAIVITAILLIIVRTRVLG